MAADSFEPYKGAALIKFEQEKQSEYSIPLANLKKSGRSWVPIRAEIVQGDISSNLFQFARDVDLTRLYDFYKNQLSDASSILYECQGRTCGSSNAWANNFFNDYRLYGADANQSLLVTSLNDNNQYQVVYLNRRGAGDVMLRIDTIEKNMQPSTTRIDYQVSLDDKIAIRRHLDSLDIEQRYFVVIAGIKNQDAARAFSDVDDEIEKIKASLGSELSNNIRFINLGNQGSADFGENQVSVLIDDNVR